MNDVESNITTTAIASEFILPLRISLNPKDEIPQPPARGKKGFLSSRKKAVTNASDNLNAVNAIAEQESTDNSHQPFEEDYRYTTTLEEEIELAVLREMFKALEEESLAEIEQAAEDTQLKLEAQTVAQTVAREIALRKSSVAELKSQRDRETRRVEKAEKTQA